MATSSSSFVDFLVSGLPEWAQSAASEHAADYAALLGDATLTTPNGTTLPPADEDSSVELILARCVEWVRAIPPEDRVRRLNVLKRTEPCKSQCSASGVAGARSFLRDTEPQTAARIRCAAFICVALCQMSNDARGLSPHLSGVWGWNPLVAACMLDVMFDGNDVDALAACLDSNLPEGVELGTDDPLLCSSQVRPPRLFYSDLSLCSTPRFPRGKQRLELRPNVSAQNVALAAAFCAAGPPSSGIFELKEHRVWAFDDKAVPLTLVEGRALRTLRIVLLDLSTLLTDC